MRPKIQCDGGSYFYLAVYQNRAISSVFAPAELHINYPSLSFSLNLRVAPSTRAGRRRREAAINPAGRGDVHVRYVLAVGLLPRPPSPPRTHMHMRILIAAS